MIVIGAITVAAGFYYYLRVVAAMYWQEPAETTRIPMAFATRLAIVGLIAGIIVLGVFPQPIVRMLHRGAVRPASEMAVAHAE